MLDAPAAEKKGKQGRAMKLKKPMRCGGKELRPGSEVILNERQATELAAKGYV
jgi:hypothetical protein